MDVTEPITEAVQVVTGGLTPEHLEPIYKSLSAMFTMNVAALVGIGLIVGVTGGLMLWRWLK